MDSPLLDARCGEGLPALQTFLRASKDTSSFQRRALERIAGYCESGAVGEQRGRNVGLVWTGSVRWCHHYVRQVIDSLTRSPGGCFRRLSDLRLIPPMGRRLCPRSRFNLA